MNYLDNHKRNLSAWQLAKMKAIIRDRWKEVWEIVLTRESGSLAKNLKI